MCYRVATALCDRKLCLGGKLLHNHSGELNRALVYLPLELATIYRISRPTEQSKAVLMPVLFSVFIGAVRSKMIPFCGMTYQMCRLESVQVGIDVIMIYFGTAHTTGIDWVDSVGTICRPGCMGP